MQSGTETKSKGYTLKGALSFVEREYGPDGKQRLIEGLDEKYRKYFQTTIIPSDWYPFEAQVHLYETIDRLFGKGDFHLCWKIGRFTAEFELSTIHKILLKIGGAEKLMKLSGMMWGRYYSSGRLETEDVTSGNGVALVKDFNPISEAFCLDLAGWMERTLELTGARKVLIRHTECILKGHPACRYEGEWEK